MKKLLKMMFYYAWVFPLEKLAELERWQEEDLLRQLQENYDSEPSINSTMTFNEYCERILPEI